MSLAKLKDLTHYICWKVDDPSSLGATKLNKVLWLADVLSYRVSGEPITGSTYVKRQFGPVPKLIMIARRELVQAGRLHEREETIAGFPGVHFVALTRPDTSAFSPRELELVDAVIAEVCGSHSATSISQLSHDAVWHAAKMGEEIPYFAWLGSAAGEFMDDDFAWADKVIAEIEGHAEDDAA